MHFGTWHTAHRSVISQFKVKGKESSIEVRGSVRLYSRATFSEAGFKMYVGTGTVRLFLCV